MKKILVIALAIISFSYINVSAASLCSYSEQASFNNEVATLKFTYEEKTGLVDPSLYECSQESFDAGECQADYDYFTISVLNMSPNFYVEVTNNQDGIKHTFNYEDAVDGVVSFDYEGIMNVTKFTFNVYSSSATNCPNENYRKYELTTPRKNVYYYYGLCQNNPEYYLCDKYVYFGEVDFYNFVEEIEEHIEEKEKKIKQEQNKTLLTKILEFISENRVVFITVSIVIVAGIGTTITYVVVRKKRVL